MRFLIFPTLALAGSLASSPVAAATIAQTASGDCYGFFDIDQSATNENVTASGGGSENTGFSICSNSGKAVAGGGYAGIGAEVYAEHFGIRETSTVYSRAAWSDTFEITAPANWTGGAIDVQVVFGLRASARDTRGSNSTDNASGFVDFELLLSAQSSRAGTNPWSGGFSDRWAFTEWDSFDSRVINRSFISAPLSVVPGLDTLSLGIDFDVTAFASAPDGAFEVLFDGLRTASLATNGPAFILPDGFFVTNASANVYNNHWIDPRATPAPVPLPAGAPLLLAGLASLGWIRRRRAGAGRRPFTPVGMAALTISAGIAFAPGQIHAATFSSFAQAIGATSGDPACGSVPLDTSSATNDTSSATYSAAESNCTVNANATAGAGYASGIAMSSISPGGGGSTSSAARFDAFGISIDIADGYDEVYLSDLHPSGLIDVTLATTFSGTLEAQENQPGWNFGSGYGASIRGRVSFGNAWYDNIVRVGANGLEQYDIDVFSENIFLTQTVDWTEALSVTMILNVEAGGQGYYNGSNGFASADASNTLSFSKTGPVFILPEGFTVNAPELNIFDNRWIDPRTVAPSPVPLPAGAPLLLAGLAALWFKGRRTGRQARKIAAMSSAAVCVALATMLPLQVNAATVSTTATIVANSSIDTTCGTATSITVDNPTDPVTVFDSGPACNAYAEVDINQGVIGVGGSVEQGLGSASSARISASGTIFATGIQLVPIAGLTLEEVVALIGTDITVTANLELD